MITILTGTRANPIYAYVHSKPLVSMVPLLHEVALQRLWRLVAPRGLLEFLERGLCELH
jgi:hypothetical protein